MKKKLADFEDFDDVVVASKAKRTKTVVAAKGESKKRTAEQVFDSSAKNQKSKKQTAEEPEVESPTKKKVKFDDLNSPGAHNDGDEVYQQQVQKLRDRKANRKAVDKMLKGQAEEETE